MICTERDRTDDSEARNRKNQRLSSHAGPLSSQNAVPLQDMQRIFPLASIALKPKDVVPYRELFSIF